ncbi:peptide deformylase [Devosia sp. A449]
MPDNPILPIDHPILSAPSLPVEQVNEEIMKLTETMFSIMDRERGAGLAAVQIGRPLRIVVIDMPDADDHRHRFAMLNPEIVQLSDDMSVAEEGCLSMPGYGIPVPRHGEISVRYLGIDGRVHQLAATGPLAVCVQHEVDHTNGVLFFDRVSKMRRRRAKDYFRNIRRQSEARQKQG